MRNTTKQILFLAGVAAIVGASGSAYTESIDLDSSAIAATIAQASAEAANPTPTEVRYTLGPDGMRVESVELSFAQSTRGRVVRAGFAADTLVVCTAVAGSGEVSCPMSLPSSEVGQLHVSVARA